MANDNTTAKDSGKYFVTLEQTMPLPCIQRDIHLEDTAVDPPITNVWIAADVSTRRM
eukprot:CAMPEP_0172457028 /NCGR_PEP_ID=MMETSP1065-20121228/19438_1 /TAXON_ID=265537 /ORGANISM="Amphiprora paludosa, Strain CCMP125" /LENGTH=56 /DNA_ID=CAMNT_0013210467 /DNA_START=57 /DNA_END=227 /DNA_ORIENTATION=-